MTSLPTVYNLQVLTENRHLLLRELNFDPLPLDLDDLSLFPGLKAVPPGVRSPDLDLPA